MALAGIREYSLCDRHAPRGGPGTLRDTELNLLIDLFQSLEGFTWETQVDSASRWKTTPWHEVLHFSTE